jgi:hypothetical protein
MNFAKDNDLQMVDACIRARPANETERLKKPSA